MTYHDRHTLIQAGRESIDESRRLRAELKRTKAELAKAQRQLDYRDKVLRDESKGEARLLAENAKLREAGRQVFGELERVELGIVLQDEDAQNVALAMQAWRAAVGGGEGQSDGE